MLLGSQIYCRYPQPLCKEIKELANPSLDSRGGYQRHFTSSEILVFEPVCYKSDENFPHSNELPGYFFGFSDNVWDAFCYKILTKNMTSIIHRSVMRSAGDPDKRNRRVNFDTDIDDILDKRDG